MIWNLSIITLVLLFVNFADANFMIRASHGDLEIKTVGKNGEVIHYEKIYEENSKNTYSPKKKSMSVKDSMVGMVKRSKREIVHSCSITTTDQHIFVNKCNATVYNLKVCSGSCPTNKHQYYGCRMDYSRELEVDLVCPPGTTAIQPTIFVKDALHCECKILPIF